MDRRESLKVLFVGTLSSSILLHSCVKDPKVIEAEVKSDFESNYGRTAEEKAYDRQVYAETFLTDHEYKTVSVLADIILPKEEDSQSASEAGVPEFIRFIVKDMPSHQLPIRGGLQWLDRESARRFQKKFIDLNSNEQISIVEDIAYPDDVQPEFEQGASFFTKLRDLTLTGFYTSKQGIKELGYMGNQANFWDGVPEDELAKHKLSYDQKYLSQYITMEERNEEMIWEEK